METTHSSASVQTKQKLGEASKRGYPTPSKVLTEITNTILTTIEGHKLILMKYSIYTWLHMVCCYGNTTMDDDKTESHCLEHKDTFQAQLDWCHAGCYQTQHVTGVAMVLWHACLAAF